MSELKKVPLKDQLILAERLSHDKKMKDIARWAGRMKVIANRKQRSKYKDAINRNGIKQGNAVEQLLPMELGSYASPTTRMDFLRRYVEGQTLQYDTKGPEQLGKGPIILCLDQSGSMRGRDTISKGFALALMSIARKQRRDFAWIPFSSHAADPLIYERGKILICRFNAIASGRTIAVRILLILSFVIATSPIFSFGITETDIFGSLMAGSVGNPFSSLQMVSISSAKERLISMERTLLVRNLKNCLLIRSLSF
nr:hypothetical protein [Paenibacillus lentus]